MSYLRSDWDGRLQQAPGSGHSMRPVPVDWKEHIPTQIGIDVIEVSRIGTVDWIHIRFSIDRCGMDDLKALKPVDGWLPAYRADGRPAAWFYSRGC